MALERATFLVSTLQTLFGAPAVSSRPRKHARTSDGGITHFLKTYCFTQRLHSVKGAAATVEVDPKALGTLIHDQLAAWAPRADRTVSAAESARIRASLLPQTRALIAHFESKRMVLLGANIVVTDPTLHYDTPIDLLAVDVASLAPASRVVKLLLVELKTTRRRPAAFGGPRSPAPLAPHLAYQTPENYARLQATLPAIRMNEVLGAHASLFRARGFDVRVLPYIVFLRMADDKLSIDEYVAPLAMQTPAFRDSLLPLMAAAHKKR